MGRPISGSLVRKTNTTDEALGAVITELRIKRGLGYEDVAYQIGCSPSYVNGIEHGKQNPTLKVIQAIADAHQVKLSKALLLGRKEIRTPPQVIPHFGGI